jgi:hypothetical protein
MKLFIKLSLVFLVFHCSSSFSQELRYIDIIVADTVLLQPVSYTYQISVGDSYNIYDIDFYQKDSIKDVPPEISDIEKDLKKENFTYTTAGVNDYSLSKSRKENSILLVTLKNKHELDRLIKLLRPIKGISGKITDVKLESPVKYYPEMFKSLYNKAVEQTTSLATVSGNQIGRMLSVSEVKCEWEGLFDKVNQLSKKNPYESWFMQTDLFSQFIRKLEFRFELK